jgi:hypothetical protein
MSKIDDGGQAFPTPDGDRGLAVPGMSLRDYFAGQAINAMMLGYKPTIDDNPLDLPGLLAKSSYRIADAMLAARLEPSEHQ